jgi:hypothetical protein
MSGQHRLSREGNRAPSPVVSNLNFGLIAMVLLATLAITATLMFPDVQLQFLAGP